MISERSVDRGFMELLPPKVPPSERPCGALKEVFFFFNFLPIILIMDLKNINLNVKMILIWIGLL